MQLKELIAAPRWGQRLRSASLPPGSCADADTGAQCCCRSHLSRWRCSCSARGRAFRRSGLNDRLQQQLDG